MVVADHDDETALVERAVAGDRDAFRGLYTLHASAVFGYLVNRVGAQRAEDLAAETFARAYGAIGRYQPRGVPFRAWLFRIAQNLIIGQSRRKASTAEILVDDEPIVASPGGADVDAISRLETAALLEALRTLPEAHQQVIELRYLHDLSVGEVSSILDIGDDAVRALTYRALKGLRKACGSLRE